jgi:Tol biopolymer transport system component
MKRMTGILVLAVALVGCRPEPQPPAEVGQLLAAGLPSSTASASEAEQDSSPMVVRRLWFYPDGLDFWGGPSPDGRYVTFVDWKTEDLAVHDFRTGENRRLTTVGSLPDSGFAVTSAFSPDGKLVAYGWEGPPDWNDQLRIVGFDGSNPRVLHSNAELNVNPEEWTADGTKILVHVQRIADRLNQIGLVSAESGSLRVLVTLDQRAPYEIAISPDGRYVVYDFPSDEGSPEHDIFVVDVATREVRTLVEHPADDRVLGWAPDGKHVLFASDRTGTLGAWLLPVADGKSVGRARLVMHELWRVSPLGFARDGSYLYGVPMSMPDVYVATLDVETGNLLDHPTRVSHSYFGRNGGAEWSPDGRYLAYVSLRSRLRGAFGTDVIVVRSTETGEVRELRPNLRSMGLPEWSPDGRSLLVRSADEKNRRGLFRVDAQTGEVEPLIYHAPGEHLMMARWRGNNRTLLLYVLGGEDGSRISVRNLETGGEEVLYRGGEGRGRIHSRFDGSSDGQQLAFVLVKEDGGKSLMVMPTAGGEPGELFKCDEGDPWPQVVQWSHDGRYVYYVRWGGPEEDPSRGLWRVPAGGGEPEQLDWYMEFDAKQIPSFHSDGRRIAFTVGEFGAEVWVMEDFLPATAGTSEEE